jgi:ATP-dependent RNA helicase DDX19/DBP5
MEIGQSIIFANRKDTVAMLADRLHKEHGFDTTTMTGAKDVGERVETMKDFYSGKTKALIATDVASRGIDNIQVTLVVNYDVPLLVEANPRGGFRVTDKPDSDTYYHRIGRAGRFGREGVAITLVHDALSRKQVLDAASAIGAELSEYTGEIEDLGDTLRAMELQS